MAKYNFIFYLQAILMWGCSASSNTLQRNSALQNQFETKLSDTLQKKFINGVDFVASGEIPATWNLELDFDKNFKFTTNDGIGITTYAAKAIDKNDFVYYEAQSSAGQLDIYIYQENCGSNKKKVTVKLLEKKYSGCGQYLYNNQLNNTWILEQAGFQMQDANTYSKGLPTLTFDLVNNTMSGQDGCNNLHSGIFVQGTRIFFGPIVQTKMFCRNNNLLFEQIITQKISGNFASYFFNNEKLVLYLIDDSHLVFTAKK